MITLAGPDDRAAAVQTMVAAFVGDPALRYFFPDDDSYPGQAAAFFGSLFDKRVGRGGVFLADGGAALALWDPPTADLDQSVVELPDDVVARLDAYEAAAHALLPQAPHWYLGVLATHPEHRGHRFGRALMADGTARAHAAGLPAYLETSNPRNVDIYRDAGWSVVGQTSTGLAGESTVDLPIWVLSCPVPA